MDSNPSKEQAGLPDSVSLSRRRLLRTAASAAPLIATLPSGAAMAQASAANCVIEDQEAARRGLPDAIVEPGSDNYIRVPGSEKQYLKSTGGGPPFRRITVYEFRVPGSPSRLVSVDKDGNWIDTERVERSTGQWTRSRIPCPLPTSAIWRRPDQRLNHV